jgi:uncharacterized protein YbjT (DUF2867 family)
VFNAYRHHYYVTIEMAQATGGIHVVLGARGGTGIEVVKKLCEQPTNVVSEIRGIMRDTTKIPDTLRNLKDDRVKLFVGDCTLPESLATAFEGASTVFFCASASPPRPKYKEVDELGVKNAAEVALQKGVGRLVLVSSQLVHPSNRWTFVRLVLNNIVGGGVMDAKYAGEKYLRNSGQAYTIIRPGRLTNGPAGGARVRVGQTNGSFSAPGAVSGSSISRADLADVCVAAALSEKCRNVTFEVAAEAITPSSELESTTSPVRGFGGQTTDKATEIETDVDAPRAGPVPSEGLPTIDRDEFFGFGGLSAAWDNEMI